MNILRKQQDEFGSILKQTEKKFGRGLCVNWRNKDFEDLSFEINLQTKILISPATLKRLFGKVKTAKNYTPQENTLKALNEYSGYSQQDNKPVLSRSMARLLTWAAIVIPIILVVTLLLNNSDEDITAACTLELIKVEGKGPATAYFNCCIPKSKDSIFIDFGDESKWKYVTEKNQSYSQFYGYPGYFSARLKTRKKNLSEEVKVYVPTKNWQALAYYFKPELRKRYFPVPLKENTCLGEFHASRKNLSMLGIDSTEIVIVRLDNFKETDVSGDSFTLHSRFKNASFWPAIRCFSVYFYIQGTNGQILFKFVGEGCSHHSEYILGEKYKYGGRDDLTQFAVDLSKWSEIEIKNVGKLTSVSINDSLVFEDSYQKSIGNILGATILFHGSGSVDYYRLFDENGKIVFGEDFDTTN